MAGPRHRCSCFLLLTAGAGLLLGWAVLDTVREASHQSPVNTVEPAEAAVQKVKPIAPVLRRATVRGRGRGGARCSFRVPSENSTVGFNCGRGEFISVVKSVCKTQLGNQLSSYAALLYFIKHGFHAFLDPVQTRAISTVFQANKLGKYWSVC